MKRIMLLAALLIVAGSSAWANQELFENGDFNKGKSGWKGDYDTIVENGNMIAVITADSRKIRTIEQRINTKDVRDLSLKFKYKTTPDFQGRGMVIRFDRMDGSSTYRTMELKPVTEWQDVSWDFGQVQGAKKIVVSIEIQEGTGKVALDDFTITGR